MLLATALALLLTAPAAVAPAPSPVRPPVSASADEVYDRALQNLLAQAFPDQPANPEAETPTFDRAFLDTVLASPAFVHGAAGPFDVYVLVADDFEVASAAEAARDHAVKGLQPLADLMGERFGRPEGLISGQRFPIVLCRANMAAEVNAFDGLIALLDRCASGPGSWVQNNGTLFNDALRKSVVVRTWDVQLVNLAHESATSQGKAFLAHGLGYYTLAHLVHGLLRQGSWGLVPPWLDQGLIDELDIEAYGESWVGSESWESETEGWFRAGWSGFLPTGMQPPPPVTGPPADLATTIRETGDAWARRSRSGARHWSDLAADLGSEYPPSLAFMAENASFLPRDRAYARCVMHLLLVVATPDGPSLLEMLDQPVSVRPGGMYGAEPLASLVSAQLGGVPDVDRLAAMPLGEKLEVLEHPEIAARIEELGGAEALAIADHRDQSDWLAKQLSDVISGAARQELWSLFLEAEYYEQMAAWEPLGIALDAGARAALTASPDFPDSPASRKTVATAFRAALPH